MKGDNESLPSIRVLPDPVLRQKAKRVTRIDDSILRLVDQMIEVMHQASGAGLAAPQIGISLRVIVCEPLGEEPVVLVNPQVVKRSGERVVEEGCLSIPGYRGEIKRSVKVLVKGLDRQGRETRIKADELMAEVLEHEIDHLNGVLYIDHLDSREKLHRIGEADATEEAGPSSD